MSGNDISKHSHIKVLVVEDNEVNQKVTAAMLSYLNISYDIAENGCVAIEQADNYQYDLILMDCQMPVKNGFDTTKYIRGVNRKTNKDNHTAHDVIIIAMTANASERDMHACLECGMNDFIAKPVELEIIETMLDKWFS